MHRLLLDRGRRGAEACARLAPALTALVLALCAGAGRAEAQGTVPVNLKFREELRVGLSGGALRTGGGEILPAVERVLRAHGSPAIRRLFSALSPARLQSLESDARTRAGRPAPSLGSWHRLEVAGSADPGRLLADLNALAEVDTAYRAPGAPPPPGWAAPAATPDFTSEQTYQGPAQAGLNALFARTQPGGDGTGVRLIDVEYDWFLAHEDLRLEGASLGGACVLFCGDDHGTAVLGIIGGRANAIGVTGGVPGATLQVISPFESDTRAYNLAGAIVAAGATLGAGDVLLVEQQAVGPHGGRLFVPAEWDPAVFEAIRVLTQGGVIVVEPAGNGGEDLDGAAFNGRFDRSRFDSDAIIVGAGSQQHARSPFSTYGSRVDLQGWGCCVVSTGFGDLFGSSRTTYYTRRFDGTSSAAAMVAAAAAAVQGFAKTSLGRALPPANLTAVLRATGTVQTGGAAQPVGPFPDLRAALLRLGARPQRSTLTLLGAGAGTGTVASTPAGIGCTLAAGATRGTCAHDFETGTVVTLTATPAPGSRFESWSGACSGTGDCRVTVDQATTVRADFTLQPFTLTVAGTGAGNGSVAGAPVGIACTFTAGVGAGVCAAAYPFGSRVTLTATAAGGSSFTGWSGPCTGIAPCAVTVSETRTVTAGFALRRPTLTLTGAGDGNGTVAGDPGGITCAVAAGATPTPCVADFAAGTVVTLTAAAAEGSVFTGWAGDCSGSDTCQVTLTDARAVSARFQLRLALTLAGGGNGAGSVTSEPGGIDCAVAQGAAGGSCTAAYISGTAVTLTAAAATGSGFGGWTGACTGSAACVLTMSEAQQVTATFTRTTAALVVSGAGTGSGTVSGPAGPAAPIDCRVSGGIAPASGCRAEVAIGSSVALSAAAAPGSLFAGWGGAGVGCPAGPTCTLTVAGETGVTARFIPQPGPGVAAGDLLGSPRLTAEQKTGLDLAGNRNGRFDVGDYLALLDREEGAQR